LLPCDPYKTLSYKRPLSRKVVILQKD
jgi:hypothetical protein